MTWAGRAGRKRTALGDFAPAWWLLLLEVHFVLRDTQRAEYFADVLAADVAGASAVIALQERLLLYSNFRSVVQRAAPVVAMIMLVCRPALEQLDAVPERERERRRKVARLETARLDETHPPTGSRIALLERRSAKAAKVTLAVDDSSTIDLELTKRRSAVEHKIVDEHRDSLYYRYR